MTHICSIHSTHPQCGEVIRYQVRDVFEQLIDHTACSFVKGSQNVPQFRCGHQNHLPRCVKQGV